MYNRITHSWIRCEVTTLIIRKVDSREITKGSEDI